MPSERLIMKYAPPVSTRRSVAIAAIESAVSAVIDVQIVTMISVFARPTFPTTQPNRRYMITPRIVRIDGVNTPAKVPNPLSPTSSVWASLGAPP